MSRFQARPLADITSQAANAGVEVSDFESATAWVLGTFVGTVQMQISPDGTNWVNSGSAVTAVATIAIPDTAKQVRFDCTAYTSGTIEGVVTGRDVERRG